jgi:hypothetical protein
MGKGVKDFVATDQQADLKIMAAAEASRLDRIIHLRGIILDG